MLTYIVKVLESSLSSVSEDIERLTELDKFLTGVLAAHYDTHFTGDIMELFQVNVSLLQHQISLPLFSIDSARQLVFFDGNGPFGKFEGLEKISLGTDSHGHEAIDSKFPSMTSFYAKELEQLAPFEGNLILGRFSVFFLSNSESKYHSKKCHYDVQKLTEKLWENKLNLSHLSLRGSSVIIVIRSPQDLFTKDDDNMNVPISQSFMTKTKQDSPNIPEERRPSEQLFGRYEIIHGEYSEAKLLTSSLDAESVNLKGKRFSFLSSEGNIGFKGLINAALSYLSEAHDDVTVTFVSCNWKNGKNFMISQDREEGKSVIIRFESLLPCCSTLNKNTEALLKRITESLPVSAQFQALEDTFDSRALLFQPLKEPLQGCRSLPLNLIKLTTFTNPPNLRPLMLFGGPRCIKVGRNDVYIEVKVSGNGSLHCQIFELFIGMTEEDFRGLLQRGQETLLKRFTTVKTQECNEEFAYKQFYFDGLQSFTRYGAVITGDFPSNDFIYTCVFQTVPRTKDCLISFLFVPITNDDCLVGEQYQGRLDKLNAFVKKFRLAPSIVIGVPCSDGPLQSSPGNKLTDVQKTCAFMFTSPQVKSEMMSGVQCSSSTSNTRAVLINPKQVIMSSCADVGGVYMMQQDSFCFLLPKVDNDASLTNLCEVIEGPAVRAAHVKVLLVFTSNLLIPSLRWDKSGQFVSNQALPSSKSLCIRLFHSLIAWKLSSRDRECKIFGTANIPKAVFIKIFRPRLKDDTNIDTAQEISENSVVNFFILPCFLDRSPDDTLNDRDQKRLLLPEGIGQLSKHVAYEVSRSDGRDHTISIAPPHLDWYSDVHSFTTAEPLLYSVDILLSESLSTPSLSPDSIKTEVFFDIILLFRVKLSIIDKLISFYNSSKETNRPANKAVLVVVGPLRSN